jgi:hypothetical protein
VAKTEMYTTRDGQRRFQVSAPVTEETYQALRLLAFEQATTLAAQVRKATDEYVARLKKPSSHIR